MSEKALGLLTARDFYDTRQIEMPAPTAGIFDCPRVAIPLNVEWRSHIISALSRLDWEDAWSGTEEEKDAALQEIMKLGWYLSNGVWTPMMRQNPDNPCVWQQSLDCGQTWEDIFDMSECLGAGSLGTNITYETNITEIQNDYDDTLISINVENLIYDASGDDDYRDTGLCMALRGFVEAAARTWVKKDQGEDMLSRLVSSAAVIIAGGIMAAFTFASGGVGLLVAGAIGSAIALAAINIDLDDETQLYDPDVIDDIVCCMYRTLSGATPTETAFQESLDTCVFDSGSYSESLQTIMQEVVGGQDSFFAFLKLWSGFIEYAENGLIENECLDCPTNWMATGDLMDTALPYGVTALVGEHVDNSGIEFRCQTGSPDTKNGHVEVIPDFAYDQGKMEVQYRYTLGSTSGSSVDQAYMNGTVDGTHETFETWAFGEVPVNVSAISNVSERLTVTRITCKIRSSRLVCDGSGELRSIIIWGDGTCPFEGKSGWVVEAV